MAAMRHDIRLALRGTRTVTVGIYGRIHVEPRLGEHDDTALVLST